MYKHHSRDFILSTLCVRSWQLNHVQKSCILRTSFAIQFKFCTGDTFPVRRWCIHNIVQFTGCTHSTIPDWHAQSTRKHHAFYGFHPLRNSSSALTIQPHHAFFGLHSLHNSSPARTTQTQTLCILKISSAPQFTFGTDNLHTKSMHSRTANSALTMHKHLAI